MSNLVPDGWVEESIGKFISDSMAGEWGKEAVGDGNDIPVLRATNFSKSGAIDYKKLAFRNIDKAKILKKSLQRGDIVLEKSGGSPSQPVGRVIYFDSSKPFLYSNFTQKLIPSKDCDNKYLFYKLYFEYQNNTVLKFQQQTTGIINFQLKEYLLFKTIFPPISEQQKIAKILTSVDEMIEKTQAQIDKLKDLKTGMMQELLTNGIGHTEFKDSPVGRIPSEWKVKTLDKIISTMDGGVSVNSENKPRSSGQFGILKTSSIAKGKFFPLENKVVLPHEVERLKTPVLADHIIFSRMNTPALVGESGYIPQNYDDLFLPDRLWQIDVKCRKETNVLWLSYVLASNKLKAEISELATGTSNTMKNISKPKLLSIKVACPEFKEQMKISKSLKSIDTKVDLISSKLEKLNGTKKALMQDLLTGKIRVKA